MQTSILRRQTAAAAAAVILGAVLPWVVGGIQPAAALPHPPVTIGEGEEFDRTYPIIAGNNPANQAHRPSTCQTSAYCDVIRLTIKPPSDPDAAYFVRIIMSWTTRTETDTAALGEVTNNDMDMYVYYVPYDTSKRDSENQATSGATGAQPEVAYVDPAGDYDIVVVNFLGVNEDGYRLSFKYVTDTVFTPIEVLDDSSGRPPDTSGTEEASAPSLPPLPALGPSPFIQPPVDFSPLTNFDDPFGLGRPIGSVSDEAGDLFRQADNASSVLAPAKPVSAAAAMFWLVGFPLLLVGLAGAFFMRRRSTSLSLDA